MAKSDNENIINIQSSTQFEDEQHPESNPPPILTTNNIDAHGINVNSNGIPSSSSFDPEAIITDLKNNKIIGAQNDVEDVKTKEGNVELKETVSVLEVDTVEKSDNSVLRKLLRGPRYFDPPDNNWGNCSNCREAGHTVANCTAAKRKKPCFVCGSLEHNPKRCKQGRVCFNCKQGGHRAKNCPEKSIEGFQKTKLCLKCGDSGHEMFTCRIVYSPDDLKEIRCYICKCFGHLCCVDYGRDLSVVSCYKCGQLGHTGLECSCSSAKPHDEKTNTTLPSLCNKCGEEGHKTRKCKTYAKRARRSRRHRLKENKDDVAVKSAPHELGESRKRIKTENGSSNSSQPKGRGAWINEHHGGYNSGTHRGSPSTPVTYRPKNSFHEYHYPSGFQYEASGSNGHHQHRFSASRFGNSSNHERKEYSWDY